MPNVVNYTEQGGARDVVGGSLDVVSGGDLDIESGAALKIAGTDITALLAVIGAGDKVFAIERVALAAVDTAGGFFAWLPGFACIVGPVIVHMTTKTTGASTIDVGIAANVTTLSDTLIDGLNGTAAAGAFSSIDSKGTNGAAFRACGATEAVTGSIASGASAGIVGFAYIPYIKV